MKNCIQPEKKILISAIVFFQNMYNTPVRNGNAYQSSDKLP